MNIIYIWLSNTALSLAVTLVICFFQSHSFFKKKYLKKNIGKFYFLFWFIANNTNTAVLNKSISHIRAAEILIEKNIISYIDVIDPIIVKIQGPYYDYLVSYLMDNRNDGLLQTLKSKTFFEAVSCPYSSFL